MQVFYVSIVNDGGDAIGVYPLPSHASYLIQYSRHPIPRYVRGSALIMSQQNLCLHLLVGTLDSFLDD